jgi:dual specificity phosphatase 12
MIDHVIDGVHISGWRATLVQEQLRAAGIINVLKLYEGMPHFDLSFNVMDMPIEDGEPLIPELLKRGVAFIVSQVDAGKPILVMCGAGISRSATFVLAYMLERNHDLHDAYRLLHQQHPIVQPHPTLWRSLIEYYELKYTVQEAFDWMHEENG